MKLNELLDLDMVCMDTVKSAISNRDLLKRTVLYPSIEFFTRIKITNSAQLFSYWTNDSKFIINALSCASSKYIPLFPDDIIEVKPLNKAPERMTADVFENFVRDSLADLEGLITSKSHSFQIYNIESIKLIKEHQKPEDFLSYFENISYEEMNEVKERIVYLLNDNFPTLKTSWQEICLLEEFKEKFEEAFYNYNHIKPIIFSRLEAKISQYLKTKNVLYLVQIIEILAFD